MSKQERYAILMRILFDCYCWFTLLEIRQSNGLFEIVHFAMLSDDAASAIQLACRSC
jgi:hypothetical protein